MHLVEALDDLRGWLMNGADHSAAALRELLEELHHLQARRAVQSAARSRNPKGQKYVEFNDYTYTTF